MKMLLYPKDVCVAVFQRLEEKKQWKKNVHEFLMLFLQKYLWTEKQKIVRKIVEQILLCLLENLRDTPNGQTFEKAGGAEVVRRSRVHFGSCAVATTCHSFRQIVVRGCCGECKGGDFEDVNIDQLIFPLLFSKNHWNVLFREIFTKHKFFSSNKNFLINLFQKTIKQSSDSLHSGSSQCCWAQVAKGKQSCLHSC